MTMRVDRERERERVRVREREKRERKRKGERERERERRVKRVHGSVCAADESNRVCFVSYYLICVYLSFAAIINDDCRSNGCCWH